MVSASFSSFRSKQLRQAIMKGRKQRPHLLMSECHCHIIRGVCGAEDNSVAIFVKYN